MSPTRVAEPPMVLTQRNVPEALRALGLQERAVDHLVRSGADYVDRFSAPAPGAGARSAEEWARIALDDATAVGRFLAWRVCCNLRLEPHPWMPPAKARSDHDHIAGWRVADRGAGWLRLEASSWFLSADVVFQVEPDRISFATFVRYDRAVAGVAWPLIAHIHRRAAPGLLRRAVRRAGVTPRPPGR